MPSEAPQVRVGVGVFVLKSAHESLENPRFLIGERINSHGSGTFALPGGHLEFGESLEACAARELEEETGLKVKNIRFMTATDDFMPADNKHYVTMFMVCERENENDIPQTLEPHKCLGWEWSCWEDLLQWRKKHNKSRDDELVEKRLFTPLLNLASQRPGVLPTNI